MNKYVVVRRFRQSDGRLGKVQSFNYCDGIKAVRKLCGGRLHLSKNATMEKGRAIYMGENGNINYVVTSLGRWRY